MLLYHGTSETHLPNILKHGLRPRGKHKGNWAGTVKSNPKAVYLTNSYALHFALAAQGPNKSEHMALRKDDSRLLVLEIDSHYLDDQSFVPDEDFLEQATRHIKELPCSDWNMKRRTVWFRNRQSNWAWMWSKSLDLLGNVCYLGHIPPGAISRYALVSAFSDISFASDPTITLTNYSILGGYYRTLTRMIFDPYEELPKEDVLGREESLGSISREGIEVIDRRKE